LKKGPDYGRSRAMAKTEKKLQVKKITRETVGKGKQILQGETTTDPDCNWKKKKKMKKNKGEPKKEKGASPRYRYTPFWSGGGGGGQEKKLRKNRKESENSEKKKRKKQTSQIKGGETVLSQIRNWGGTEKAKTAKREKIWEG